MLSLHTSPLVQPGAGDSGGMNVYVRELVAALAHAGIECTTYTRQWSRDLPREILVERAGLLVPANTPEGDYLLIAGLYNPADEAARLVTIDGPDFVSLGAVRVVKAR